MKQLLALSLFILLTASISADVNAYSAPITRGGTTYTMVIYDFWSGEYPKPVIDIRPAHSGWTTIRGYASLRNPGKEEMCTVRAGVYHPWSKDHVSLIDFYTIIPKVTYVARRDTTVGERRIARGDVLEDEVYLAEGDCSYVLNKRKKITAFCLDNPGDFRRMTRKAHPSEQWLYLNCQEGYNVFVQDRDLVRQPHVRKGKIVTYGEVEAIDSE